jgi:4-amino-4-deoxy-L-arabinose transferase-like glycosyltransferase
MLWLATAAPWHAIAAVRNPGFLWDYVMNQHVLVFFDAKLPRDSIPDSLGFFWTMVVVRGLPWSLLLPAAVLQAWKGRHDDVARTMAFRLVAVWLGVVLGFFSVAASRLEHYSLPAMPATALLIGSLCADALRGRLHVRRAWLLVPVATAGCVAAGLLFVEPRRFLEALEPSLMGFALEHLVSLAGAMLGVGLLATATLGFLARDRAAFVLGMGTAVAALTLVQLAHERVEVLFSWRPFARLVAERGPDDARIFFRASDEYQLCGGLEYYLARRLDLLAPPGWVPPTFLEGRTERLFTDREEFDRVWRESPSFFVSDDVDPPGSETALVPGPHNLIVRAGTRVLLQSRKIVADSCHPGKPANVAPSG